MPLRAKRTTIDEGVPIRDIAEVIGRHLDVPLVSISGEDAGDHFAWLAGLIGSTPRRRVCSPVSCSHGSRRRPG
jgi:hypothetical protein